MQKQLSLGFVVRNESSQIQQCLNSFIQSIPENISYEFLVVDNHSEDETINVVKHFFDQKQIPGRIFLHNENNMAKARQKILEESQAPLIYFSDADCLAQPETLSELLKTYRELNQVKKIAGVGGGNRAPFDEHVFYDLINAMALSWLGNFGSTQMISSGQVQEVSHLSTCSALYHKQTLMEVGGFDSYFSWVGEDLDLSTRINSKGYSLFFNPSSMVWHRHRTSINSWLKKVFKYGWAQPQVCYRNKKISYRLLPLFLLSLSLLFFKELVFFYLLICIFESLRVSVKTNVNFMRLIALMVATHVAYLVGEILSIVNLGKVVVNNTVKSFLKKQGHLESHSILKAPLVHHSE